ncbi:protein kinase [Lichtheimia corymbifera JMRC:FSU:9682]|uniref:Protein kinase n=1 Tax=Lichtheimia corymbifera JMRC:FSU:9682 TaxID=1263082 RepID=A0A068S9N7_9FUNG|nr:protein kinase [Lichtheimia corymbifera JMRC:FSU:9682]
MSSFAISQPTWVGNEPYAPPSSRTRSKRKLAASPRTHYAAAATTTVSHRPTNTNAIRKHPSYNDKDGHLIFCANTFLDGRYKTISIVGKGTYGQVFKCYDVVLDKLCAIKVIRAIPKYVEASRIEIRILQTLREHDPSNQKRCIQLRASFHHDDHVCMVFDLLKMSVYDFMKHNHFLPFPLYHIRSMGLQLLSSVAFLHRQKLIHTDIKPENMMLKDTNSKQQPLTVFDNEANQPVTVQRQVLLNADMQLIDFGSATFENEYHSAIVSTRHYRAPEVILNLGWSYPCDIWSIGCVLFELCIGEPLFQTKQDHQHLALMEKMISRFPTHIMNHPRAKRYFDSRGLVRTPDEADIDDIETIQMAKPLHTQLPQQNSLPYKQFADLLYKMLNVDPNTRISAEQALQHPFFTQKPEPSFCLR